MKIFSTEISEIFKETIKNCRFLISKDIFCIKNLLNLFENNFTLNTYLKFEFWATFYSKIVPKFVRFINSFGKRYENKYYIFWSVAKVVLKPWQNKKGQTFN